MRLEWAHECGSGFVSEWGRARPLVHRKSMNHELELKVQHAARGTADFIASRIPQGQGWCRKGSRQLGAEPMA